MADKVIQFQINDQESFKLIGTFKFSLVDNQFNCIIESNGVVFEKYDDLLNDSKVNTVFLSIKISNIIELSLLQVFLWQHRQEFFFPSNITIIIQQDEFGVEESINIPEYWLCMPTLAVQMGFDVLSLKNVDIEDIYTNKYENKCAILHQIIIYSNYVKFDTKQIDGNDIEEYIKFQFSEEQTNHQLTATILLQRLALNLKNNKKFAHLLPIVLAWNSYQLIQDTTSKTSIYDKGDIQKEIHFSQAVYQTGDCNSLMKNLFSMPLHLLQLNIFNETNLPLFQKMCDVSYLFKVEFFAAYSYCFDFDRSVLSQCSRSGKSVTLHSVYYFQLLVGHKIPIYINLAYQQDDLGIQVLYNKTSIDITQDLKNLFLSFFDTKLQQDQIDTTKYLTDQVYKLVYDQQQLALFVQSKITEKKGYFRDHRRVILILKQYLTQLTLYQKEGKNINCQVQEILNLDLFDLSSTCNQNLAVDISQNISDSDYLSNNIKENFEVILLIDECLQRQKDHYIDCMQFVKLLTEFYYNSIKNWLNWQQFLNGYESIKKDLSQEEKQTLISLFSLDYLDQLLSDQYSKLQLSYSQLENEQKNLNVNLSESQRITQHVDNIQKSQICNKNFVSKDAKQQAANEMIYHAFEDQKQLKTNIYLKSQELTNLVKNFKQDNLDFLLQNLNKENQQTYMLMLFKDSKLFIKIFGSQPDVFNQISSLSPNVINMRNHTTNFHNFSLSLSLQFEVCEQMFKYKLYHYIMSFFNPRGCETIFWRNISVTVQNKLIQMPSEDKMKLLLNLSTRITSEKQETADNKVEDNIDSKQSTKSIKTEVKTQFTLKSLAAGTDMALINFIRQQQTLYQCSNSANNQTYTLCNIVGGSQLHPSKLTKTFYSSNQINNQNITATKNQIQTYKKYLTLVNIFVTMLPELQSELQFLCPLISPQILIQESEQSNYCFNYCQQVAYNINQNKITQYQIQTYQQLFSSINIYRTLDDNNQNIGIYEQQLGIQDNTYKITKKEILQCQEVNEFYTKIKILASQKINPDVKILFYYYVSQWLISQVISKNWQQQVQLLEIYLTQQQTSEVMSCILLLFDLCQNQQQLLQIGKILEQLKFDNRYLSFFTSESHQNNEQDHWQLLKSQMNKSSNSKFLFMNQSFDLFLQKKGSKSDYIDECLLSAKNSYNRLKELVNNDKDTKDTDKIDQLAILVKVDFPKVSELILSDSTSLPDYVLIIFGLDTEFSNPILSFNTTFNCHIAAFESGNHTQLKLAQKIESTCIKTVIQCSFLEFIDELPNTFYSEEFYQSNSNAYYKLYQQSQKTLKTFGNFQYAESLKNYDHNTQLFQIYKIDDTKTINIHQFFLSWVQNQSNLADNLDIKHYLVKLLKVDFDQEIMQKVNLRLFEVVSSIKEQLLLSLQQIKQKKYAKTLIINIQLLNLNNNKVTDITCGFTVSKILLSLGNHVILKQKFDYDSKTLTFGVVEVFQSLNIIQQWYKNYDCKQLDDSYINYIQIYKSLKLKLNQEIAQQSNLYFFEENTTIDQQIQQIIDDLKCKFKNKPIKINLKDLVTTETRQIPTSYQLEDLTTQSILDLLKKSVILNYQIEDTLTLYVASNGDTPLQTIQLWLANYPSQRSAEVQNYLNAFQSDNIVEIVAVHVNQNLFKEYKTLEEQIQSSISEAKNKTEFKKIFIKLYNLITKVCFGTEFELISQSAEDLVALFPMHILVNYELGESKVLMEITITFYCIDSVI